MSEDEQNPIVTNNELHSIPIHSPWYHVAIDFVSPISLTSKNGKCFILTVSDYFTKWVEAISLPNETSRYKATLYNNLSSTGVVVSCL